MNKIGLILSTGRTGTQFFEYFINNYCTNSFCKHEPKPSRRFKFFSNMYLQGKLSKNYIAQQFISNRKYLHVSNSKLYIESNNFLFGCGQALALNNDLKILHIIREPKSYIASHLKHGFWAGHKKFFAKYIPFWLEDLKLSKEEKNNPVKILAKRWNYVNDTIANYEGELPYLCVRFEDLFSKDVNIAQNTIEQIIKFFNLELKPNIELSEALKQKQNVGKKKQIKDESVSKYDTYIQNTCQSLITKFSY